MKPYINYHKHDMISNISSPDSPCTAKEYVDRVKELGHTTYFTTNHGTGGDIFDSRTVCDAAGVRCLYGIEGYIVPDPLLSDRRNYHIVLIPRTDESRKRLNLVTSRASIEGYYYKPRIFINDLLQLDPQDLYITTACMAGLLKDEDSENEIFLPLYQHFRENIMLEVQNHSHPEQMRINRRCLELQNRYGLRIIAANDSHYVYPEGKQKRARMIAGKGINYESEDEFLLDYPDYDTFAERFVRQGVLTETEIEEAIDATLLFDSCEEILLDHEIKMPTIYPNASPADKIRTLKQMCVRNFARIAANEHISADKLPEYIEGIRDEMKTIEDTAEINTSDYFLVNERIVDLAVNKYNGILTRTGRGSCSGYYINKLLGMTQLDRFDTGIKLYPERFCSTARLLENRSLPDIDYNVKSQEPFVLAAKEVLGEHGIYPMVAYGTMQLGEAFRNVCRADGLEFSAYNDIAKQLEDLMGFSGWEKQIEEAKTFIGTVISASVHPCSFALSNKDIRYEYGVTRIGDAICVLLTSGEADEYKILKDDFLIVEVWGLIGDTYRMLGKPIPTVKELLSDLDDRVWKLFEDGITCTLNQVDTDYATGLVKRYKPHSPEELAMFVGAIRPSFDAWRNRFLDREPYSTGSKALDKVLESTGGYILFQENLMQYFEWLGVTPSESIGLIKKISKKKIKPEDFAVLEDRLKRQWVVNTGSETGFDESWEMIQGCISYGFCVSGDTRLFGCSLTVRQMYETEYIHNHLIHTLSMNDHKTFFENEVVDIRLTGVRNTYKVTTESGATIVCTENHKFPTPSGVIELRHLNPGSVLYVKYKNLAVYDPIVSIEPHAKEPVYSVTMLAPYHNFVVDTGIVTHNCSAHGLATAIDCLYGAYLKVHYPLQYYSVALGYYPDDKRRTMKLTEELKYFGINLKGIEFRHTSSVYTPHEETNTIYKSLNSVKYISQKTADELYALRDHKYEDFIDFLYENPCDARQTDILIRLGFFAEFGKTKKLLTMLDYFNYYSKRKQIPIADCELLESEMIAFASKTKSLYKIFDQKGLIKFVCKYLDDVDLPPIERIAAENEYLGYIDFSDPTYSNHYYIKDINTKYSPVITAHHLGDGTEVHLKIKTKLYSRCPVKKGDIIVVYFTEKRPKTCRTENGEWKVIPDVYDTWINSYTKFQ